MSYEEEDTLAKASVMCGIITLGSRENTLIRGGVVHLGKSFSHAGHHHLDSLLSELFVVHFQFVGSYVI
jgi:hypothetical protein